MIISIILDVLIVVTLQRSQHKISWICIQKDNTLIYKCHNCGVGASIKNLLKHIDVKIHNDYIFERYKKQMMSDQTSVNSHNLNF